MVKFDGIRMQDLVEVQDPDKDGGVTLVFKDDKFLHIKIVDGKLFFLNILIRYIDDMSLALP